MNNGLILRASIPPDEANFLSAEGGLEVVANNYKVHVFKEDGNLTVNKSGTYEVFIVGPGGDGGNPTTSTGYGGGGGGGQVISTTMTLTAGTTYPVVIGIPNTSPAEFNSQIAQTGSEGGTATPTVNGDGGDSYHFNGGLAGTNGAGGGGGSTSAGTDGFSGIDIAQNSQGGTGTENDWLGDIITYGAGGGGATSDIPGITDEGDGGSKEAGNGGIGIASAAVDGTDATPFSGAGGGGAIGSGVPGAGAVGIVMIRYPYEPDALKADLDTFEDIDFRLDISAIQNNEIGSNFGLASQNITLPGSKNNNKFFNAAFNVNSLGARGFKQSIPCQVLQDGAEVFNGNLILNDVVTNGISDTIYNVTLVNETVDFSTLISEQYITQLDFSDLTHTYSPTTITASFETSSFLNGDVFYPLVEYGQDGTVPDMYAIAMGGGTGKVDNANTPMLIQQFKPAIRVKALVDKIFDSVNYKYSSSFFDTDEFKSMYMLTTNSDKNGIVIDSATDAGFQATGQNPLTLTGLPNSFGTLTFDSEVYDPGASYNPATSTFSIVNSGQYAFTANIPFTHFAAGPNGVCVLTLRLMVNGTQVASQVYNISQTTNGNCGFSTSAINLTAGDVVRLDYYYEGQTVGLASVNLFVPASRTFGTLYAPIATVGADVDMAQQFDPTIKSLDFLKGLIQKFNLVIEPKKDERNTLIIEPFNTWADAGRLKDWSDKFDRAEKVSITHPIQSQPLRIKLEDSFDNDVLNQYAKNNFNDLRPYGSWTYTSNSDIPRGERKVGGFFSPIPTKGIPGAPNMIIPLLYRSEGSESKPFKFKPRLAYRIDNQGAVGASQGRFFLADPVTGVPHEISNYSTLGPLQQYPANNCNSIHYDGQWYPFHQAVSDGFTPFGAYNLYWARYINELYDDDARLLTLNMNFKPTDLIDIQLNDKIFIDNAYYRINKISGFNLSKQDTVTVELLKAPVRKAQYGKRRIYVNQYDDGRDVGVLNPGDFLPKGDVVVKDFNTGDVVTDTDVLKKFASLEGYQFISSSVYWKSDFNKNNLNANAEQQIRGSIDIDPTAGVIIGAADSGSIGQDVDKAVVIGTQINIQREVKNSYIGGSDITIGSGSDNISVFSSVNSTIGPGTLDSTLLSSSGSFSNGTLNTQIGTLGSNISNGAIQSTLIGTRGVNLNNAANTFERTTHIGGNKFEYYNTSSGEDYSNSVGLGQLPDVPTNAGVDKRNKVIIGDSLYTGGVWLKIQNKTATAGGSDDFIGDNSTFMVSYTWSGSNGTYILTLPDASVNRGRWMQFFTDGTFNGSTTLNLVPSGSQTINGSPEFPINQDYSGAGIISDGSNWFVIGGV